LHPEDARAAIDFCVDHTAAGRPHRFEYRMLAADGREVWIEDLAPLKSTKVGSWACAAQ
ncbi:MAG: PAS domain-containing protein, partial [Xanthomonadales bacterium]|nr:PAS domain-containing protein [Xanthomonadales bacterium]